MTLDAVQVPAADRPADGQEVARIATRLGTEYALRSLRLMASVLGGDIIATIIVAEIVAANTAHLNGTQAPRYSGLHDLPPDDERRPVSALAVAGSLGLPRETVRRYVKKLEAVGICRRVKGGVIVPTAILSIQENQPLMMANVNNLRQLVGRLQDLGFTES